MPFIEIQSKRLKCRAFTKEDESYSSNELNKYAISDDTPLDDRHIIINTKADWTNKKEPPIIKKLTLDFPFYFLSKNKKILEKLKFFLQKWSLN